MKTQTKHSLMLMLCAFIWGTAFVAQSAGSGMGAYSFLAGRSWLAVLVLIPTVFAFDAVRKKTGPALRLAEGEVGAQDPAGGGPRLRHLPVCGLCGSADRHHH